MDTPEQNNDIYSYIQNCRTDYKTRNIKIAEGYDFNQYKKLNTVELYFNSRFETGQRDSQGLEKAFYNINKSRVLVEVRATDLDTKDIQIIDPESITNDVKGMMFSKENKLWMKKSRFGVFLNKLGFTASKYGGAVVKKTEHDGLLELNVIPWRDLTTDQTDILSGVIIERHFYTPGQLKQMEGKWQNIDEAIELAKNSKAADYENGSIETQGDYIEVWEVHGELPDKFYEEGEIETLKSDEEYFRQMHVVVFGNVSTPTGAIEEQGVTLFKGREKENPYKYFNREEVPGRALGVGIVEELEQAQVWTNKAINEEKKVMELAGKIVYQQSGKGIVKNILTDVDNGTVVDNKGQVITQLSSVPSSLPEFQNLVEKWNTQAERVTSTYAAMTGDNLPSGTAYRLGALQNQEANSQFEYLRENKGLFVVELFTDWVIPYLKKRLNNEHTLVSDFTADELQLIDKSFQTFETNQKIKDYILNPGNIGTPLNEDMIAQFNSDAMQKITATKNRRGIKIPKDYYKDCEFKLDIIVTNEQRIKAVYLETLSNILQTVAANPAIIQDPVLSKIFTEIMEVAGFDTSMIATAIQSAQQPKQADATQVDQTQAPTPTSTPQQIQMPNMGGKNVDNTIQ